jgi:ABC-type Fe3+-siderophore transport system permease subunit
MIGGLSFMVAGQMCCGVLKNDLADPEVLQTWVHRGTDYVAAHSAAAKRRKHG